MTGVVVKTVEELEAANKRRALPTIIVEGELARNILASGILTPLKGEKENRWGVPEINKAAAPSPTYDVIRLLYDMTQSSVIEVINGKLGIKIKIYPKPANRREGN